jgi:predicted helicase
MANCIAEAHLCATSDGHQCFPFYVYDEDGTNRRENITDWALQQFRTHYGDDTISKWDIFYYVYGLLHHPGYRTKFADNLKRELPRIPFAPRDFLSVSPTPSDESRVARPESSKGVFGPPAADCTPFEDSGRATQRQ